MKDLFKRWVGWLAGKAGVDADLRAELDLAYDKAAELAVRNDALQNALAALDAGKDAQLQQAGAVIAALMARAGEAEAELGFDLMEAVADAAVSAVPDKDRRVLVLTVLPQAPEGGAA